jgi:N-acetylneuraminate lyase
MNNWKTEGLVAAPPTGFSANGDIDLKPVAPMAEHLHQRGVTGVFVNGTTGEGMSLTCEERESLAEEWGKALPESMKFFIHIGHNSLADVCRLARHAETCGADAVGIMAPNFFQPSDTEALIDWCASAARSVPDTPLYLYHMPSMTGVDVNVTDFLRRAGERIPNLAGIKFTFEALDDYFEALRLEEGRYDVLWGRDEMLLGALAMGARGAVGSTFNAIPELSLKVMEEFSAGNLDLARDFQEKVIDVIRILAGTGSFFAALKVVLHHQGVPIRRDTRCPVSSLSEAAADRVITRVQDVLQPGLPKTPIRDV